MSEESISPCLSPDVALEFVDVKANAQLPIVMEEEIRTDSSSSFEFIDGNELLGSLTPIGTPTNFLPEMKIEDAFIRMASSSLQVFHRIYN